MLKYQKKKNKIIKAIDLFSGAGGFSLAALELNIEIILALELDKDACETYKHNLIAGRQRNIRLINDDINNISVKNLMNELGLIPNELDMIIGGPPCQGFSSHRIKNKGVDDPRNNLLIRYFDFVNILRPKLFLVENVPGLLWERHKSYLLKFKELALESGYDLHEPVKLNAKDYGAPQNRNRVFLLGVRNDIINPDIEWPPQSTHFKDKTPYYKISSEVFAPPSKKILNNISKTLGPQLSSTLKFGNPIPDNDPCNIHMNHANYMIDRFSLTPINGSREDTPFCLPCHQNNYSGHKDVYGRIRLGQAGPTITTGCFNPSKGRFLHPWENHGITIRHAARFQTFPDDYIFKGGIISQGRQVGNAVPVKMGTELIKACINILKINEDNSNDE
ncbi:DNA cytosine methyltransferase [Yersinia enterocolitica]|uniref:DNA cytosine methyltransferase n=1 Tax=Yersinia enterocolitica TaxID=630 RepID=UPI002AC4AEBC|nr:DNA cytosine methyltransferase [Yersinia enterocolitica]HDL7853108.1 DNA cytosine methyltransferase [Yersinia enterocolitica]HEN3253329.1 DNA cytosine methyltransferase [Yersinia enterocolitica]